MVGLMRRGLETESMSSPSPRPYRPIVTREGQTTNSPLDTTSIALGPFASCTGLITEQVYETGQTGLICFLESPPRPRCR
jgi:hypothetical protein